MTHRLAAAVLTGVASIAPLAAQDLPKGYPVALRTLQSVPRLVRQHSNDAGAAGDRVAKARSTCDAGMPAWNGWVESLTSALDAGNTALPDDIGMRSSAAAAAAASCTVERLAVLNLPALSATDLAAQEKALASTLQQVSQDVWASQGLKKDADRKKAASYLRSTLTWAPWGSARP
jgi:hypothetical protein